MENDSNLNRITYFSDTKGIKKISTYDLPRFLLDSSKVFARESIALKEIYAGRARMFGIFPSDGIRESLYILERV